ncbi:hypothetical protein GGF37_003368 [Kickxella alabastrina]|nr:hypothetical protein GGF37_003368 [Kickxella alabastrina]
MQGQWGNSSPRTSYDGCSVAGGFSPTSPRAMMRFSLSKQRRCRRQSVVGAAPASLQRIADEATSIREECEKLLALMSPLYRDGRLSARSTMTATSPAAATVVAAELQPTAMPTPPLMSGSFSFRSSLSFDSNNPRPSSMLIDEAHLTTF